MQNDELIKLNIRGILEHLPHRYPFLLVDRVTELMPNAYIKAYKNVTINEPFFQGHFPGLPVMPGVLMLEALAQAGGIFTLLSAKTEVDLSNSVFLFTGIEKVRFRSPVYPGDKFEMELDNLKRKLKLSKMTGRAYVNGKLVVEAELTAAITNRADL